MKHLLLKYISKEEYVNDFLNGSLYMNSLYYFWTDYKHEEARFIKERYLQIHPDIDPNSVLIGLDDFVYGQGDNFEGVIGTGLKKESNSCKAFGKHMLCDPIFRSIGLGYCNALSFYRLDLTFENGSCMYNINELMNNFGDFVIIIKNEKEFVRRIKRSVEKSKYKFICGNVQYVDFGSINQHHLILKRDDLIDLPSAIITSNRDCFNKTSNYSWQNEWRIALYRGVKSTNAFRLEVGDLKDIVEVVPVAKLDEGIQKVLSNKLSMSNYSGNISRTKFKELFNRLEDYKVKEFVIIG